MTTEPAFLDHLHPYSKVRHPQISGMDRVEMATQQDICIHNNKNLNYNDLEQRIALNLRILSRGADLPAMAPRLTDAERKNAATLEGGMLRYRTKQRSLLNKAGAWFKSLLKLYKTRDQAILGLKLAAKAEDRVTLIEARIDALNDRIDDLCALGRRLEGQLRQMQLKNHESFERAEQSSFYVEEINILRKSIEEIRKQL